MMINSQFFFPACCMPISPAKGSVRLFLLFLLVLSYSFWTWKYPPYRTFIFHCLYEGALYQNLRGSSFFVAIWLEQKEIYNMQALYGYHEWKLCPNTFPLQVMGCRRKGLTLSAFEWERRIEKPDIWAGRLYVWRSTL